MKTSSRLQRFTTRLWFLMLLSTSACAQAGWLDSAKRLLIEATEPIGLAVIVIGGMKISTKDLYGGIAAVVGGIFIFKAQDIIAGLR